MTSKKTYSIVLTALISFGLMSTAYAQEANKTLPSTAISNTTTISAISETTSNISKDEAKNIAKDTLKNYFEVSIDDTKYQTNINFVPDYQYGANNKNYIWQINWNSHDGEKDTNINISVEANTGKISNVDIMTTLRGQATGIANLTEEQAKEAAKNFLNKINPKEFSECKLTINDEMNYKWKGDPTAYNFNFCRMANDIPFMGNFLNVSVDSATGKIRSYSFRWSDNPLPAKDNVISQEKAAQLFKDNLNLDLKYVPVRDEYGYDSKVKTTKIAYTPDMSSNATLDAKEGKMLDYDNTNVLNKKIVDLDENQKKSFVESYKPTQKLDKELNSSSAEAIMNTLIKDIYGEGYAIESTNYQDNNNGGYRSGLTCWSGHFTKKDASNGREEQGEITIDSSTGQLVSINKYSPFDKFGSANSSTTAKLTWEQSYNRAIEVVKKYFPDKIKDIDTKQTYINRLAYDNNPQADRFVGFYFNRSINGISYQEDGINMNFDSFTGEINNINCSWTKDLKDLNVPSANGVISKSDAQNIFFNTYKPQLQYALYNKGNDPKNSDLGVKLVYSILDGLQYRPLNGIDAFKGNFIDYNGQELDNNIEPFKAKIKGSAFEKELSILASLGVIETKNFDLNKEITRADLIKMLVNAKGYRPYILDSAKDLKINYSGTKGDETYKYLQMAVSYGVLDNSGDFKGDEKVTKEELVKDVVKLLGYDKLAQAKGIFALSYNDVGDIVPDNLGYVAISKGLGLTVDTDNKFKPKEQVKITDAAVTIYRALNSLRSNGY